MRRIALLLLIGPLAILGCIQPQPTPPPPVSLAVTLNTPTDGSAVPTLTPTLAWSCSSAANSYHLQVASDSNFQSIVVDSANIGGLSYSVMSGVLNYGQAYYWRISASKGGQTSGWSSVWAFKTQGTPYVSISVSATIDDMPWTGNVNFSITGPHTDYGSSVPTNFSNLSPGTYTITYNSGGPQGATLAGISPLPTQTLSGGGSIGFSLDFHKQAKGTIAVSAVLDGMPWTGNVSYSIQGPYQDFSSYVPQNFSDLPIGRYTLSYHGGGPAGATIVNITPSPTQNLGQGQTIYFTMYFHRQPVYGTIEVNAVSGGQPIFGHVQFVLSGPTTVIGTAPARYNNMPVGVYTLRVTGGEPIGVRFAGILPSPTQALGQNGQLHLSFTITYQGAVVPPPPMPGPIPPPPN